MTKPTQRDRHNYALADYQDWKRLSTDNEGAAAQARARRLRRAGSEVFRVTRSHEDPRLQPGQGHRHTGGNERVWSTRNHILLLEAANMQPSSQELAAQTAREHGPIDTGERGHLTLGEKAAVVKFLWALNEVSPTTSETQAADDRAEAAMRRARQRDASDRRSDDEEFVAALSARRRPMSDADPETGLDIKYK